MSCLWKAVFVSVTVRFISPFIPLCSREMDVFCLPRFTSMSTTCSLWESLFVILGCTNEQLTWIQKLLSPVILKKHLENDIWKHCLRVLVLVTGGEIPDKTLRTFGPSNRLTPFQRETYGKIILHTFLVLNPLYLDVSTKFLCKGFSLSENDFFRLVFCSPGSEPLFCCFSDISLSSLSFWLPYLLIPLFSNYTIF